MKKAPHTTTEREPNSRNALDRAHPEFVKEPAAP
jgi:hypothetical protein